MAEPETIPQEGMLPERTLIQQGAEARIYKYYQDGQWFVAKERFKKTYRHPVIDLATRRRRTKAEARCIAAAMAKGIPTAPLVDVTEFTVIMKYLNGPTLMEMYIAGQLTHERCREMGAVVKQLHEAQIIHSDLTTSNFILHDGKPHVIDFGLAVQGSVTHEAKAVDLYVLEKALIALTGTTEYGECVLQGYQPDTALIARLDEVRKRGRKK